MAEEDVQALTRDQISSLQKVGLTKEQISIVVHNLEKAISSRIIPKTSVEIVVHNLVSSEKYRKGFFSNPQEYIREANPQPSP